MEQYQDAIEIVGTYGRIPQWRPLPLGDAHTKSVPYDLTTHFPAGTLAAVGVAISLHRGNRVSVPEVTVYTVPDHNGTAEAILDNFTAALAGELNPYRGRQFQASLFRGENLVLTPFPVSAETRAGIVLPESVWREVELFVATATHRREALLKHGHSTSRGLLLAGDPGVGKTMLGRILAAELVGTLTVIVTKLEVFTAAPEALFQDIERLGPTLVIVEDMDTIASRENRADASFSEFLNALDGARVRDGVLILATTNYLGAIDPAAKRPGRFDSIVEVPLPNQAMREDILRLYLRDNGEGLDIALVAEGLDGASGADLREIARRVILEHGGDHTTTEQLLEITRSGRWKVASWAGNYL